MGFQWMPSTADQNWASIVGFALSTTTSSIRRITTRC